MCAKEGGGGSPRIGEEMEGRGRLRGGGDKVCRWVPPGVRTGLGFELLVPSHRGNVFLFSVAGGGGVQPAAPDRHGSVPAPTGISTAQTMAPSVCTRVMHQQKGGGGDGSGSVQFRTPAAWAGAEGSTFVRILGPTALATSSDRLFTRVWGRL